MKRLPRLLIEVAIGLAVVAGGTWGLIHALGDHEALYQGKPLGYWCEAVTNRAANETVQAVITNEIIPRLTNEMFCATNDSKLRTALIDQLNNLPGVNIRCMPADGRRAMAAAELGNLGRAGKPAIPALLKALQSHDYAVRGLAATSLVQVETDPAVLIPALLDNLARPGGDGRAEMVRALAEFDGRSKEAVPMLIKLWEERSDKDLMEAVRMALKRIDPEAGAKLGGK